MFIVFVIALAAFGVGANHPAMLNDPKIASCVMTKDCAPTQVATVTGGNTSENPE